MADKNISNQQSFTNSYGTSRLRTELIDETITATAEHLCLKECLENYKNHPVKNFVKGFLKQPSSLVGIMLLLTSIIVGLPIGLSQGFSLALLSTIGHYFFISIGLLAGSITVTITEGYRKRKLLAKSMQEREKVITDNMNKLKRIDKALKIKHSKTKGRIAHAKGYRKTYCEYHNCTVF